ncbi:MAG: ABC transporter ATP-binding protein [Gammaproteobacteria bacterium]
MIEIENLTFRYPEGEHDVISGLSMRIQRGSLFGLLGPNGSGKTTLISILTGLLPSVYGQVRIDHKSYPQDQYDIQTSIALVPQEYAFYPRLSVVENLFFFGQVQSIPVKKLSARVCEAVTVAGLGSFETVRAENLSGGLKRRLNLAIGLLNQPQLLFLDEPTVGIDPHSRHFILETVRKINNAGTTVVYTSHYMEEVEALCDEIAVLDNGKMLACGTLSQLLVNAGKRGLIVTLMSTPTEQQRQALLVVPGLKIRGHELCMSHCSESDLWDLMELLETEKLSIVCMKYGYGNLEEWFLQTTGRQLRA